MPASLVSVISETDNKLNCVLIFLGSEPDQEFVLADPLQWHFTLLTVVCNAPIWGHGSGVFAVAYLHFGHKVGATPFSNRGAKGYVKRGHVVGGLRGGYCLSLPPLPPTYPKPIHRHTLFTRYFCLFLSYFCLFFYSSIYSVEIK